MKKWALPFSLALVLIGLAAWRMTGRAFFFSEGPAPWASTEPLGPEPSRANSPSLSGADPEASTESPSPVPSEFKSTLPGDPKGVGFQALLEATLANKICAWMHARVPPQEREDDYVHALFRIPAESGYVQLLLNLNHHETPHERYPGVDERISRFLRALSLGGLLEFPAPRSSIDLPASEQLLSQIASDEPGNSAPLFFRAAVEKELGRPDSEQRATLLLAMRRTQFDTHVLALARKIWLASKYGPASFLMAQKLTSRLPIGDYTTPLTITRALIKGSAPNFAKLALEFGPTMMHRQLSFKERGHDFVNWIALEYAVGQSIYKAAWARLNPGKPVPAPSMIPYNASLSDDERRYPNLSRVLDSTPETPCPNAGEETLIQTMNSKVLQDLSAAPQD